MVNSGRSSACLVCKRRKIKCDETKPSCSRCVRASLHCIWTKPTQTPGYRFVDMTEAVTSRQKCALLKRFWGLTAPTRALGDDQHTQAMNFFVRHYMLDQGQDGAPSAGLFGLFQPAFANSSQDSSAAMAVSALALSIYSRWRIVAGAETEKSVANVLGRAIYRLSNDLQIEDKRRNDITLLATLTLQFHSSFESLFGSNKATVVHHLGAIALVRDLGPPRSWTSLANSFVAYILHVEVAAAIREHRRVHPELCYWSSVISATTQSPDGQIDALGIRVADVQFLSDVVLGSTDGGIDDVSLPAMLETLLAEIQELERCLVFWQERVSHHWGPFCWTLDNAIVPPIQTYKGACHVYTSIRSARLINIWRSYRLTLSLLSLQLIRRHRRFRLQDLDKSNANEKTVAKHIRWLVDGFCASVPFFLGNRTKIGTVLDFDDPAWKFPTCHEAGELRDMKGQTAQPKGLESIADHRSHAIAQGVWLIMGNLTQLVAFFLSTAKFISQLPLESGQLAWICQQYLRNLSLLSVQWTLNSMLEQRILSGVCLPPEEELISEARRCVQRVQQGLKMTGD